jgi:hypothetical protein
MRSIVGTLIVALLVTLVALLLSALRSHRTAERREMQKTLTASEWVQQLPPRRVKWLWTEAWTEANFWSVFMRRNRCIARSVLSGWR